MRTYYRRTVKRGAIKTKEKTITWDALRPLYINASPKMPDSLNIRGERWIWNGARLVRKGKLQGDETLVVE